MFKSSWLILFLLLSLASYSQPFAVQLKAEYEDKNEQVKISWIKTDKTIREFILQKSTDQFKWKDIARQKVSDFNNKQVFQFLDRYPERGKNYYRLKIVTASGTEPFSATASANAIPLTYNWNMYPVPVKDVLTLQYKGTAPITGVVNVSIQGVSGNITMRMRYASTNTVIPITVSNLGKGIYNIAVMIEGEVTWSARFVK